MKERVYGGLLAFALCFGIGLPRAKADDTISLLYKIQLQNLVNQHGIVSAEGGTGVYDFVLVDVSADGIDELFVLWKSSANNMSLAGYTLSSGNLQTMFMDNSLELGSTLNVVQTDFAGHIEVTGSENNNLFYGWHSAVFQDLTAIPWGSDQQILMESLKAEKEGNPSAEETAAMITQVNRSFEDFPGGSELSATAMNTEGGSGNASSKLTAVGINSTGDDAFNSNVSIDFNSAATMSSSQDVVDYLGTVLGGVSGDQVNDAAKSDIVTFVEAAISQQTAAALSAQDNAIRIGVDQVSAAVTQAFETKNQVESYLSGQNITLNKEISLQILLQFTDVSMSEALQVTLDNSLLDGLGGVGVQLLLEDGKHGFRLTNENLSNILLSHGEVTVQLHLTEANTYSLQFLDFYGEVIDQLFAPVGVILPCEGMFSTVIASFLSGDNNWGGQYDGLNSTIYFQTPYTGNYVIIDNYKDINDISPVHQAELAFMVSKGFFSLDDAGNFYPSEKLTRYDFTEALVRMFFAMETGLTTAYTDLPTSSPYYDYVASSEAKSITFGYEDGTFRGDNAITTEEVLSLVARTLSEKKGYFDPENPSDYLSWVVGADATSPWGMTRVALAIREGVVLSTETLEPSAEVSRQDAAVYLYRLFMLLEEPGVTSFQLRAEGGSDTPPPTSVPEGGSEETTTPSETPSSGSPIIPDYTAPEEKSSMIPLIAGAVAAVALLGGVGFVVMKKRKGGDDEEDEPKEKKGKKGGKEKKGKKAGKDKKAGKEKKGKKDKKGKKGPVEPADFDDEPESPEANDETLEAAMADAMGEEAEDLEDAYDNFPDDFDLEDEEAPMDAPEEEDLPMEEPEEDLPMEEPEEDLPMEEPEEDLPMEEPEEDLPMEEPEEDLPMEEPEEDLPMEEPEEDLPMEEPEETPAAEDEDDYMPMEGEDEDDYTPMDGEDEETV